MNQLAINGGEKIRTKKFPSYQAIGKEEEKAVLRVLKSGVLSRFLGIWHKDFYGGPEVQTLEQEWARYFKVKHAIAVNSCTSGLYCAVGACGIGPGDEVIVSPYTMSASATAPLIFNAIPVFADIEEDFFCLDPEFVAKRITKYTKAIIVVDIFGQPYDADKINAIAKRHNLYVIEDCAQAPGAKYKNKFAGTLGDLGVYSLNYHKHIHTGEGGMVVTNNDQLAERVRLIRNHAEAVVENKKTTNLVNMVGFNFRMMEIEAALARCQLKKLNLLVKKWIINTEYLNQKIGLLPGITAPAVRPNCTHVFYAQAFKYDEKNLGIPIKKFIQAVNAELMPMELRETEGDRVGVGYVKPLYLQPIYQRMVAYGDRGCPFKCPWYKGRVDYKKGICPVVEKMHNKELFSLSLNHAFMKKKDLNDVVSAFEKVYLLRETIKIN